MKKAWVGDCCSDRDTMMSCTTYCFPRHAAKSTLQVVSQVARQDVELLMTEQASLPSAQQNSSTFHEEVCVMQMACPDISQQLEQEKKMDQLAQDNRLAYETKMQLLTHQLESMTEENQKLQKALEEYKSFADERQKTAEVSNENNRVSESDHANVKDASDARLLNAIQECDATPVASNDELFSALQGFPGASQVQQREIAGKAGASSLAERYNWVLAIALPNPSVGDNSRGITWKDAANLFDKCFKGEEVIVDGASKQQLRFLAEKSVFHRAFKLLPAASEGSVSNRKPTEKKAKMYSGRDSFLTLFRNFVMTKLSLHCGLVTEAWYTEDHMKIVLMISCTARDLLREADRQNLTAELELAVVDPQAVMPVTKSYFPLLHWYFKLVPVKQDDELVGGFLAALSKLQSESPELKEKFHRELAIWEELEDDVIQIQSGVREQSKRDEALFLSNECNANLIKASAIKRSKSLALGSAPSRENGAGSRSKNNDFGFVHPLVPIGTSLEEDETKRAFAEYLKLKSEYGFSKSPLELIAEANKRHGKATLQTTFDVLGLTPSNPFRSFEVGLYNVEEEGHSIWREFEHASQNEVDHIKSPFSESQRIRLVKNIIDREFDIDQMLTNNLAESCFPLDTRGKVQELQHGNWVASPIKAAWSLSSQGWGRKILLFFGKMSLYPPLEEIRNYYGERIAMYFGFVSFLGKWMIIPAVIGIVANIIHTFSEDPKESDVRLVFDVLYSVGICVWSSLFLEHWKRQQLTFATKWGQWNINATEAPRPRYHGITRMSPIKYEAETYFPQGFREFGQLGRLPRQIISWCILTLIALVMVTLSVLVGFLRSYWIHKGGSYATYAPIITSLITSAQMFSFSNLGRFLAHQFNEWENYRSASVYQDFLITKLFLFEFVNRFNVYFFIGFVKSSQQGCVEDCVAISKQIREAHQLCEFGTDPGVKFGSVPAAASDRMCLAELRIQLTIVLIVLALTNVVELFLPMILPRVKQWVKRLFDKSLIIPIIAANEDGEVALSHVAQEVMDRSPYGTLEVDGTFDDYLEIMILFGYVTLFSLVFPFASVIATALLLLELRVDGAKLFYVVRRPLPQCAETIGSWRHILKLLTWLSMFTNAAMLVWTFGALGKRFPDIGNTLTFAFLIFVLIIFKVVVECLVSDEPGRIRVLKAHQEWLKQRIGEKDVNLSRDPRLSIHSVDLDIKHADTGRLSSAEEFGTMRKSVRARVSKLQKKLEQKKKDVRVQMTKIENRIKKKRAPSATHAKNDLTFDLHV